MRLGCGFRQPNSETEFGASVMVTPPYGCNTGSAQQRADVGIGPYGETGRFPQPPGPAAHSGAAAPAVARNGWELEQESPPKGPATPDNPSVSLRLTAPFTQGSLGDGDADRRVASLLAMTALILCHSEEAQRADVGIRPFYDGQGFGPPYLGHGLRRPNFGTKLGASVRSSAPTEAAQAVPSSAGRGGARRLLSP